MKLFDKILLGVLAALAIVAGVAFALLCIGWPLSMNEAAAQELVKLFTNSDWRITVGVLSGLMILLSARMLVFVFHRRESRASDTALIQNTETGGAFITINALNEMVKRYVQSQQSVRSCKTAVKCGETGGVIISVRLALQPNVPIVPLTASLQSELKTHVETLTGIPVKEVGILIEDAAAAAPETAAVSTGSRVR